MLEAGEVLGDGVTECTLAEEEELLEAWSADDAPIEINEDVDLEAFRASAEEALFPEYEDEWGEFYRALQEQ